MNNFLAAKVAVNNPVERTFNNIQELNNFLQTNGASSDVANRLCRKMQYASSVKTVIHDFNMNTYYTEMGAYAFLMKLADRTSTIYKLSKKGNNYVVSIAGVKGSKGRCVSGYITAPEIEQINAAIDRNVRPYLIQYSK